MKKIFIDCTPLGYRTTGVERYTKELVPRVVRRLSERYHIDVWHSADLAWLDKDVTNLDGVKFKRLLGGPRIIRDQLSIPYIFKREYYELAWFPIFPPSPFLFALNPNVKIIRTIFDGVLWNQRHTLSFANKYYYSIEENLNIKKYASIHTISNFSRAEITEVIGFERDVIVSGIGVNNFSLSNFNDINSAKKKSNQLLFVGTIEPRKNLIFLVEVIAKVKEIIPDVKLIIAGRHGWGAEALIKKVNDLQLNNVVHLIGSVTDAQLMELYATSCVFVFPSISEGFGLPPVEAMTAGCPVISSNAGALSETVGSAGVLISPDDHDEWGRQIIRVIKDDNYRSILINSGFENAKRYSWDAVADQIASDFEFRINKCV